jgi:hypothetical protein
MANGALPHRRQKVTFAARLAAGPSVDAFGSTHYGLMWLIGCLVNCRPAWSACSGSGATAATARTVPILTAAASYGLASVEAPERRRSLPVCRVCSISRAVQLVVARGSRRVAVGAWQVAKPQGQRRLRTGDPVGDARLKSRADPTG